MEFSSCIEINCLGGNRKKLENHKLRVFHYRDSTTAPNGFPQRETNEIFKVKNPGDELKDVQVEEIPSTTVENHRV